MPTQILPLKPKIDKKNILILFLAILNLFLISYVLLVRSTPSTQTQPTTELPTPSQTVDPTSTWLNYSDSDYGLSLKYPPEWGVVKSSNSLYLRSKETSDLLQNETNTWIRVGDIIITKMLVKELPNNTRNLPLSNWINSQEARNYGINPSPQPYELGGLKGYITTSCGEMCTQEIYLDNKGTIYLIDSGNSEFYTDFMYQILSTFKFTN